MKKTYNYKFKVGNKVYKTNSFKQCMIWLRSCMERGWTAYCYDFTDKFIYLTMNGKQYNRRFGSKKMTIVKNVDGSISKRT